MIYEHDDLKDVVTTSKRCYDRSTSLSSASYHAQLILIL